MKVLALVFCAVATRVSAQDAQDTIGVTVPTLILAHQLGENVGLSEATLQPTIDRAKALALADVNILSAGAQAAAPSAAFTNKYRLEDGQWDISSVECALSNAKQSGVDAKVIDAALVTVQEVFSEYVAALTAKATAAKTMENFVQLSNAMTMAIRIGSDTAVLAAARALIQTTLEGPFTGANESYAEDLMRLGENVGVVVPLAVRNWPQVTRAINDAASTPIDGIGACESYAAALGAATVSNYPETAQLTQIRTALLTKTREDLSSTAPLAGESLAQFAERLLHAAYHGEQAGMTELELAPAKALAGTSASKSLDQVLAGPDASTQDLVVAMALAESAGIPARNRREKLAAKVDSYLQSTTSAAQSMLAAQSAGSSATGDSSGGGARRLAGASPRKLAAADFGVASNLADAVQAALLLGYTGPELPVAQSSFLALFGVTFGPDDLAYLEHLLTLSDKVAVPPPQQMIQWVVAFKRVREVATLVPTTLMDCSVLADVASTAASWGMPVTADLVAVQGRVATCLANQVNNGTDAGVLANIVASAQRSGLDASGLSSIESQARTVAAAALAKTLTLDVSNNYPHADAWAASEQAGCPAADIAAAKASTRAKVVARMAAAATAISASTTKSPAAVLELAKSIQMGRLLGVPYEELEAKRAIFLAQFDVPLGATPADMEYLLVIIDAASYAEAPPPVAWTNYWIAYKKLEYVSGVDLTTDGGLSQASDAIKLAQIMGLPQIAELTALTTNAQIRANELLVAAASLGNAAASSNSRL